MEIVNKETGKTLFKATANVRLEYDLKSHKSQLIVGELTGISIDNAIGSRTLKWMARKKNGEFSMSYASKGFESLFSKDGKLSKGGWGSSDVKGTGKAWVSTPEPSITSLALCVLIPFAIWWVWSRRNRLGAQVA